VDSGHRNDAGSIENAADATPQSAAASRRASSPVWRLGKVAAGIVVGLATIASFVVAWLQLKSQLEQIEAQTRPPVIFDQRIDSPASVSAFVSFATENDYQVRRVNLECLLDEGQGSCAWVRQAVASESGETILYVSTKPGCRLGVLNGNPTSADCVTHWIHVRKGEPFDAQVDNGEYGAGNVVVRGYFAISLRNALGSAPQNVKHIFLRAVAPEMVGQR
jgi:hypothetical protein